VAGSSSGHPTPASGSRSRIHFSDDQGSSAPETSPRASRVGAGSPLLRKSTQTSRGGTTFSKTSDDKQRRVRSLGTKSLLSDTSPFGTFSAKRSLDSARGLGRDNDPFDFGLDPALDVFGPGALSDEYDLCEAFQKYCVLFPFYLYFPCS
jgi:hypothetical protein